MVFAFHGYQRAIHEIIHGRPNPERFHVRGFTDQGTTTTPFQMVSLNGMSRYHRCIGTRRRTDRLGSLAKALTDECRRLIEGATAHPGEHLEDPPEITNWTWTDA